MKNLKFLIPRLSLMAVLCLGLWASSAFLARFAVKNSEASLSQSIDTDEVVFDWNDSSIALSNVTVGNPDQDPMYLEMDKLTLKLDPNAVVSRRLVVREGVVTNLHLVDSRLKSHDDQTENQDASVFSGKTELVRQTLSDKIGLAVKNAKPQGIDYQNSSRSKSWWHAVQPLLIPNGQATTDATIAASFKAKWQEKIDDCRKRGLVVQQEIAKLKRQSAKPTNPLRAHGQTMESLQRISQLTATVIDLQAEMQDLQQQAAAELQAIAQIQQEKQASSIAALPQPSPASMTAKVVANQPMGEVESMMKWVDWAGNLIPNLQINPTAVRGRNVSFGKAEEASLQIDQLTLVGVTDVGGAYYRFMGKLNNFSNSPNTQSEATVLNLRAQGPQHVIVNAVYDRRDNKNKTQINIKTPDIIQPETYLPPTESSNSLGLELRISPTTAYSQISLTLEDNRITGNVTIRHANAKIRLTDGQVNDPTLAGLINYELSDFDQYETVYHLDGTIDQVVATPVSDLGDKIAAAFQNATNNHIAKMVDLRNAQQMAVLDQQRDVLATWLHQQTNDVFALIQSNRTDIASASGTIQNVNDNSLRLR